MIVPKRQFPQDISGYKNLKRKKDPGGTSGMENTHSFDLTGTNTTLGT